jgi:hypothetical protein
MAGPPLLAKGALVAFDPYGARVSAVVFQYNPETLTRTLQPQASGEDGSRSEALRLKGPPVETIKVDIEIDATDQLEQADPTATTQGIHPQLAALETLVYPSSAMTIANTALLAAGVIEVLAPETPLTLFVWGLRRVLPVRITEFTITEEAHDTALNPIRAKVSLGVRVLNTNDLSFMHPGYGVFLAHQIVKESLAAASGGSLPPGIHLP